MRDVAHQIALKHTQFNRGESSRNNRTPSESVGPQSSSMPHKITKRFVAEQMQILAPYLREILEGAE